MCSDVYYVYNLPAGILTEYLVPKKKNESSEERKSEKGGSVRQGMMTKRGKDKKL